jgi:hypothetical protein
MGLNNRGFLIWKERGRVRERERERGACEHIKVRFGRNRQKEGRDRDTER